MEQEILKVKLEVIKKTQANIQKLEEQHLSQQNQLDVLHKESKQLHPSNVVYDNTNNEIDKICTKIHHIEYVLESEKQYLLELLRLL